MGRFPAVALFAERAGQVVPGFAVTEADMAAVAGIVHWLEGMPLAIELAAARARVLSPEQIDARLGARLGDQLGLLTRGSCTNPARQPTPRASISGAMSCAPRRSGCCGRGCRCPRVASSWARPRGSAPITGWPPRTGTAISYTSCSSSSPKIPSSDGR